MRVQPVAVPLGLAPHTQAPAASEAGPATHLLPLPGEGSDRHDHACLHDLHSKREGTGQRQGGRRAQGQGKRAGRGGGGLPPSWELAAMGAHVSGQALVVCKSLRGKKLWRFLRGVIARPFIHQSYCIGAMMQPTICNHPMIRWTLIGT